MPFDSFPISRQSSKSSISGDKEASKAPKTPFRDLLEKKFPPRTPLQQKKRPTIFDLAKKEKKKTQGEEKKKISNKDDSCIGSVESLQTYATTCSQEEITPLSSVLPAHMEELIEKMVDCIHIESQKGISTTTITLDMEDAYSIFQNTEIVIHHYDTAPQSFNLQLFGSAQAVNDFTLHLPALLSSLQTRLENFQIHLLPPALTFSQKTEKKTSHHQDRKKGKTQGREKDRQIAIDRS